MPFSDCLANIPPATCCWLLWPYTFWISQYSCSMFFQYVDDIWLLYVRTSTRFTWWYYCMIWDLKVNWDLNIKFTRLSNKSEFMNLFFWDQNIKFIKSRVASQSRSVSWVALNFSALRMCSSPIPIQRIVSTSILQLICSGFQVWMPPAKHYLWY